MSKTSTMTKKNGTTKTTQTTAQPEEAVADFFASPETAVALLDDRKRTALAIGWLAQVAQRDHSVESVELTYGETLYRILTLPLDVQKSVVSSIADHNKVPRPKYEQKGRGRASSGRNELAAALYGNWPEMLRPEGNNKDSRAAMRITDHVRRFKIAVGLAEKRARAPKAGGLTTGQAKKSFTALWSVAEPSEQHVVQELFARLGVEMKLQYKWLVKIESEAADIIDVEATEQAEARSA